MWKTTQLLALILGVLIICYGGPVQARQGDRSTTSFDDPWNVTIGPSSEEDWNYLKDRGMKVAHFEEGHALYDNNYERRARMILGPTEAELARAYATSTPIRNFIGTETEGPGRYRLNPVLGEYGPMLPVR